MEPSLGEAVRREPCVQERGLLYSGERSTPSEPDIASAQT